MRGPVRIGVLGYGVGGRYFHAPVIDAAEGVELAGVVTRSRERRALAEQDWPGVPVHDSLADLLAAGAQAVAISTPPQTRRELVLEALAGGAHVVADKPFAPTAVVGSELRQAAVAAGLMLNVYHNRRWDADMRTIAEVMRAGRLGELWRVHSRLDLDQPELIEPGPDGGLLRDLGTHLVDQMLWLLGPVKAVTARMDWMEMSVGRTDVGFVLDLQHSQGARSYVQASKLNHNTERTIRAYGSLGCYRMSSSDVQAQALGAGKRPRGNPAWGYEPRHHWGSLSTSAGDELIPSQQGRYHDFYTQFGGALRGECPEPVPAVEGVRALAVLDAARLSAATKSTVAIESP